MGLMSLEGMLEVADFHVALRWHLTSNCFPPAGVMLEACGSAIDAAIADDWHQEIDLPVGALYKGQETAPAWALIDNFRLQSFIDAGAGDDLEGEED